MSWLGRTLRTVGRTIAGWTRAVRGRHGMAVEALESLHVAHLDLLAVLNGAVGHLLEESGSSLDIRMRLDRACGDPTSRICVFVHGLMATNRWWGFPDGPSEWYGSDLYRHHGYTPVQVFYNTGRRISGNGRDLAGLVDDLVAAYPERVDEIAFVGHSMGGLVVHSAVEHARREGHDWTQDVTRVALLGVPHAGSPLARLGHAATGALVAAPVPLLRAMGEIADKRSDGIKDLRHGLRPSTPPSATTDYYIAAATLGRSPETVRRLIGDWLVPATSATGTTLTGRRTVPFDARDVRIFPGRSHLGLMRDREVSEAICEWFGADQVS